MTEEEFNKPQIYKEPLSSTVGSNYLTINKGLKSWLFSLDHKRIAIMYLVSIAIFFLVGVFFALLLHFDFMQTRIKNINISSHFLTINHFSEVYTSHGIIMVFFVVIPLIPSTLGNFLLPLMIGAKSFAFPKLNLFSYYLYVLGSLFFICTIILGGLDTGWTFYSSYSVNNQTSFIFAIMAILIVSLSSILTGINFIVTIHKMRAPKMTWFKMPLFIWSLYATSIIQVLATPTLIVTLLILASERILGVGIFDPALGGDSILFQNFFWFYAHPAAFSVILPGFGIITELIAINSRKNVYAYKAVAFSTISIAILSFFGWGQHMFVSGQSPVASVFFSMLTYLMVIPIAIQIYSWIATLYKGSIQFSTPMSYAIMFLILLIIGIFSGIFLGALSINTHLHNTYFVLAHLHYTMMGGAFIAFIGGVFHWWSKITAKKYNESWGRSSAIVIFIGFNLTFLPQFIMGSHGMPRQTYNYLPQFHLSLAISAIGACILSLGLFIVLFTWLHSIIFSSNETNSNPWKAKSIEWTHTNVIPVNDNFKEQPVAESNPYDFDEMIKNPAYDTIGD